MPNTQPASQFIALFPDEDISRILQNIQNLLPSLSRPKADFSCHEVELSGQLFLKLCSLSEYRQGPIEPHFESWLVGNTGATPTILGRGDIRFTCARGVETYFLIEAKRLFVTFPGGGKSDLIADYINDGMMRFIMGQYASTQEAGAMLGYVFDVDIATAETTISGKIAASSQKLCMITAWQQSNISVKPSVNKTEHDLHGRKFVIYHLLTKV